MMMLMMMMTSRKIRMKMGVASSSCSARCHYCQHHCCWYESYVGWSCFLPHLLLEYDSLTGSRRLLYGPWVSFLIPFPSRNIERLPCRGIPLYWQSWSGQMCVVVSSVFMYGCRFWICRSWCYVVEMYRGRDSMSYWPHKICVTMWFSSSPLFFSHIFH